jgi:hypothetical protein
MTLEVTMQVDEPRTLSYDGGPWSKAGSITIPAHLVVDRRELPDDGGAYILTDDTYIWTPTPEPVAEQADDENAEHTRPAPAKQDAQVRPASKPAPAKQQTRPAPARKPAPKPSTKSAD